MMKLLVYTDGGPDAVRALHFAAEFKKRLGAEIGIITVRSGTHAAEEPPPVGIPMTAPQWELLPRGLRVLQEAAAMMVEKGVLAPVQTITIQDIPNGHMFVCRGAAGDPIQFSECFGHFVETLNKEIDEHQHQLLIIAPPRRGKLGRLVGDATRKLALDLHTSLLVVRGGGPDSRFLVCADGSPAARRQFPMLQQLLPAIGPPVDLLCVRPADAQPRMLQDAEACLELARKWLLGCDKLGFAEIRDGRRLETILEAAGDDSVIMMGASLRHDVYRRMRGSLPLQVLERTLSSVLLVKKIPESDPDFMKDPFPCG